MTHAAAAAERQAQNPSQTGHIGKYREKERGNEREVRTKTSIGEEEEEEGLVNDAR